MKSTRHTIVRQLVGTFKGDLEAQLHRKKPTDTREWTKAVLTAICKLGKKLDYQVGAAFVDDDFKDWGEWLFDAVWLDYNDEGWLGSMALAAESQWGNLDQISDAFQKLLVANASVKVLVGEGTEKTGWGSGVASCLADMVGEFHGSRNGDTYLFVSWEEEEEDDWGFRFFEIIAQGYGQRPFVREVVFAS